jgi:DNA-binding MarR family transcriptional regulator
MSESELKSLRLRHNPRQRTFYRFAILAGHYARCLASMYVPVYRLSMSDWKVLAVLGVNAPMSATEAGKRTSLQPDKVTRAVDSLVAKGLVVRRRDRVDKRRIILTVSAVGMRAFQEIDRARFAIECEILKPLSATELRNLSGILEKLDQHAAELFGECRSWAELLALRKLEGH